MHQRDGVAEAGGDQADEEAVLAHERGDAQGLFRSVVVHWPFGMINEAREAVPVDEDVLGASVNH